MEQQLQIRIEHIPPDNLTVDEFYIIDPKLMGWYKENKIPNPAKVTVANLGYLLDPNQQFNGYFDEKLIISLYHNHKHDKVIVLDIKINPDNLICEVSDILSDHRYFLQTARSMYEKYKDSFEVIRVTDLKDNSTKIVPSIDISSIGIHQKLIIGSPYRLYVDDEMITQKFYPYDIHNDQQLEETVFLDLSEGTHNIRLECLERNDLRINGFACDDYIITGISVNELSFQIQ